MGIAADWIPERIQAARGELERTPIQFQNHRSLSWGGVLMVLPHLIQTGLLTYRNHYEPLDRGYYDLDFIMRLVSLMYLCRIKNPEQLGHIRPGEFGKLLGIDRVPEAKCLRGKLKAIANQQQGRAWNMELARWWSASEDNEFYYIDGHVQVYHGYKARLGRKHVARQKLCLPGMQEFWVNNMEGLPYFYVTGPVNEKLLEMIQTEILPTLVHQVAPQAGEPLFDEQDKARFTLIFDREAYSPAFFGRLWKDWRVAVITYRKNVKDHWDKESFSSYEVNIDGHTTSMDLAERPVVLDGVQMREIRKCSESGHQTSVLTTNRKLSTEQVATYIFARWSQENFFRYMRLNYDFDKINNYTVKQLDGEHVIINPAHNKNEHQIKKLREKIQRRMATLYTLGEQDSGQDLSQTARNYARQADVMQQLEELQDQEQELLETRSNTPKRIKIKDMDEHNRYNSLDTESQYVLNILKMICYRAETSFALMLGQNYSKKVNEMRSLARRVINSPADMVIDESRRTLHIRVYSQATPRDNAAVQQLCQRLNDTRTVYPGTDLVLQYDLAT